MLSQKHVVLSEVDQLQINIRNIIKDSFDATERLQAEVIEKNKEIANLKNVTQQLTKVIDNYQKRLETLRCSRCDDNLRKNEYKSVDLNEVKVSEVKILDEQVLREVEELSSLDLESQFIADCNSTCVVAETPSPKAVECRSPIRSRSARNILEEMFGAATQSSDDHVLAPETPAWRLHHQVKQMDYEGIPETMPQIFNETTPQKSAPVREVDGIIARRDLPISDATADAPNKKCSIRLTPTDKLMPSKKPRLDVAQLISPSRRTRVDSNSLQTTPRKSKLSSTNVKRKSPRGKSTPSKNTLKKSHRIETEISHQGMRKLTQTQLNVTCFKKDKSQENLILDNSPSTCSLSQMERDGSLRGCPKEGFAKPSTPLNSLENSPDLDETNLTASAIRKIADEMEDGIIKQELTSSYDRIPEREAKSEEARKETRRRLPGLACHECERWYDYFGNGNNEEMQQLLDKCSRHRTKNIPLNNTPEGFWKPVVTQTQSSPQ